MKKMIQRNNLYYCLMTILFVACTAKSDFNTFASTDRTKPGVVTNIRVVNTPGGANIYYTLPNSYNILYVQAEYKINDNSTQTQKASYVLDSMSLHGFAKSQDYTVTLTVVTQANVSSDTVKVTVHPQTPPYIIAGQKASLVPDFGGTYMASINTDTSQALKYVLLIYDSTRQAMTPVYQAFSKDSLMKYNVRGYPSYLYKFGIYFTDLYGNTSDTTYATLTPVPEVKMNKSLFRAYPLPSDSTSSSWSITQLWDEKYGGGVDGVSDGSSCWRGLSSKAPGSPVFPLVGTFDMGLPAKLSRFVYWPRLGRWPWQNENQQNFAIWGSNVAVPSNSVLPGLLSATPPSLGVVVGDWICLGVFQPPAKPSGSPYGTTTADDQAFANAGWQYMIPSSIPKVRFIRYEALDNYSGTGGAIVAELTFYGNPN